jgi:hypothetical protein
VLDSVFITELLFNAQLKNWRHPVTSNNKVQVRPNSLFPCATPSLNLLGY